MRKILAIAALALAACGGGGGGGGGGPTTVGTPTFAPTAGTYHTVQDVTITCATSGAAIHFTTDGSTPTAASPTYAGAVHVATTTTIKAMATAAGMTDSAVASATYTLQAATPVISPAAGTYATAQSVTLTSATPGAAIHYTTDGSTPSAASPTYSTPISLPLGAAAVTTTVKGIAVATGFSDSAVASSTFVIDPGATPAEAPTFSPPAGTYTSAQSVTLASATAGVTIYYTTDGSTPTAASTVYSAPVQVTSSLTLKAIAQGGGHTPSPVASAAYVINLPLQAATPTFNPGAGSYTSAQSVTITSATAGAAIYYTTDGSTPTAGSTLYTGPVQVASSLTLEAIATATGYSPSAVASASYVIGTGGGTTFLTACNAVFDKQLSLIETCQVANPLLVAAEFGPGNFCSALQKEITAGLIAYDANQGTACVDALASLTCADLFQGGDGFVPPSCLAALTGTVAPGGTCYSTEDCQQSQTTNYCTAVPEGLTCPGTCHAYAALGGSCTSAACAPGQVCTGTPLTCRAKAAAGGPCPCRDDLWCDTSGGGAGVCTAFQPLGAACVKGSDHCIQGTKCAGAPSTCQGLVGLGATCDPTDSLCGIGWECDAGTNKCVSWPTLGQPCSLTLPFCIASYCDFLATSPTCKALLADGAACNPGLFGIDCASRSCNVGTQTCDPSPLLTCSMP